MLGTTLLFWGGMSGRPMIGLVLALLVEAKHWVRIRWDFDDEDCSKAWQFTSIAIALAVGTIAGVVGALRPGSLADVGTQLVSVVQFQ